MESPGRTTPVVCFAHDRNDLTLNTHPEFTTGNWTGFYLEAHRREPGWMRMYLDCSDQGVIRGEGIDYVGPWTLVGRFTTADRRCVWTKSYVGRHEVAYDGILGPLGIKGTWRIRSYLSGEFHIWPEGMSHLTEHYLNAQQPLPLPVDVAESLEDAFSPSPPAESLVPAEPRV